jgi:hypothetical protein
MENTTEEIEDTRTPEQKAVDQKDQFKVLSEMFLKYSKREDQENLKIFWKAHRTLKDLPQEDGTFKFLQDSPIFEEIRVEDTKLMGKVL